MDRRRTTRATTVAAIVTIVLVSSACTQATNWIKGRRTADAREPATAGAAETDVYVNELGQLASNDPAAHAEIFADAAAAAQLTPGPSTQLRLGLVLAVPGHPESDPERAQSLLRDAIAQSQLLTPAEISLATIQLNNVEQLIVVNAELRRLRASSSQARQTQDQAIAQRLATVQSENRRLRQELEEAERKLEAITSIERSIREQE